LFRKQQAIGSNPITGSFLLLPTDSLIVEIMNHGKSAQGMKGISANIAEDHSYLLGNFAFSRSII
jgi:hypothetical protein